MCLEHGGEDDAVEHDVVLADEVHEACLGVLPPFLPRAQFGMGVAKLLCVRDVTDGGIEPHVEHLALGALYGYRYAPLQVARHGTGAQTAVQPALALPVDVAAPLLVFAQNPLLQPLLVLVEGQVPVLRGLADQRIARLGIVGIDELLGRKGGTTLLALVAVSLGSMATRALALDVAVGEEVAGLLVVELLRHLLHELTLVVELAEEVARQLVMRGARGAAVDVERDAEALERVLDERVVAVHHLLHGDAFLAGTYGDGHAVFVASADEEALTSLQTEVARIDVGRHIDAGQMSDMYWSVGIRQSGRNGRSLELFFHALIYFSAQRYEVFSVLQCFWLIFFP